MAATETRQIRCKSEGCEQVVFKVTPGGEVYALGIRPRKDTDGRLVCECPVCGKRNRYKDSNYPSVRTA